ncbi:MAG: DUF3179 domain-containing protein [Chloroflexi bacterium]|nr:MAG: DUF3179 domain-containing protein [Chloroflexota bacterium]
MHDRRIDGKTAVFGNAGALFQNAMTWYDHDTSSIWSQPWGRAIQGEQKGVELRLAPAFKLSSARSKPVYSSSPSKTAPSKTTKPAPPGTSVAASP